MKYVALLSGGKDSCYNLLHCARNGHVLIAAASLRPPEGKEELDSYMYQTVGQDAVQFVAEALDVPLYRQVISGSAVSQESEYGGRSGNDKSGVQGDETEDMLALLSTVKKHHPDVSGVSVGAILSNYQRVRVEHVCQRLGLTPLAYLWQRDQKELLLEMVEAGMEAIIIKVAGIGLLPRHLGQTLAQMQSTLLHLNEMYGSHICGEGGEYETLTLDCPLFKRRITLTETETVIHSDNDFATVAYLRIKNATLEDKPGRILEPTIPTLLDSRFSELEEKLAQTNTVNAPIEPAHAAASEIHNEPILQAPTHHERRHWVAVGQVQSKALESNLTIEQEVKDCFEQMRARLEAYSLRLEDVCNISIFLSDMSLFPRVNAVYGSYFGTSPPSRACVAVDLPSPIRVRLECIARRTNAQERRQALHVQGMSYWAPANIGPYSQANILDDRVFISGQIGLIPNSLTLPSSQSLVREIALSFQHVERILSALEAGAGGTWKGKSQLDIYWVANIKDIPVVKAAREYLYSAERTPSLFAVVKELPRGALVEKQSLFHTCRVLKIPDEEEDYPTWVNEEPLWSYSWERTTASDQISCAVSLIPESRASCVVISIHQQETLIDYLHKLELAAKKVRINDEIDFDLRNEAISVRLFYKVSAKPHSGNFISPYC